jgi:apolipoprotein N-acyltransferase
VLAEHQTWRDRIGALAEDVDTRLVFGALDRAPPDRTYNAVYSWGPGEPFGQVDVYRKRRLVPVTERSLLGLGVTTPGRAEAVGFSRGGAASPLPSPLGEIGIAICFESIFPDLARRYRRAGASVWLNLTNDVWMGPTAGPAQHAAHLRLRAVETRMAVIQASNSGISEVLDPLGRVVARAAPNQRATLTADVYTAVGAAPATRYGGWLGPGVLAVLLLLSLRAVVRGRDYSGTAPR